MYIVPLPQGPQLAASLRHPSPGPRINHLKPASVCACACVCVCACMCMRVWWTEFTAVRTVVRVGHRDRNEARRALVETRQGAQPSAFWSVYLDYFPNSIPSPRMTLSPISSSLLQHLFGKRSLQSWSSISLPIEHGRAGIRCTCVVG